MTKNLDSFSNLMHDSRSYRRSFWTVVLLPVLAILGAVLALCFKDFIFDAFPDCALNTFTGLNCVSCGCTRATYAIMRGDILTAIYYNPLYIIFLCWVIYVYVRLFVSLFKRPYKVYIIDPKLWQGILIGVGIIGFFIIRNTPIYRTVFY